MNSEMLRRLLTYIDDHICEKISLVEMAELAGYSPFYFSKLFAEIMGMPITGYIRIRKLQYALASLLEGRKVLEVSLMYSFDSHEGFTRSFKEFQEQAEQLKIQIANMKQYLSSIVQGYGYKNVKEFLAEFKVSKVEYGDYRKAVAEWEKLTGKKVDDSFKAKLQQNQQQVKEQNRHTEYHKKNDRGAR